MRAGKGWSALRWLAVLASFSLLYVPLLIVVARSFQSGLNGGGELTLRWYRQVFDNDEVMAALRTSLAIAAATTGLTTLIGTAGAMGLSRARFRGRSVLHGLTYLNLVMPEIVLGLSLLLWFVILGITLGAVSVVLAHVTYSLSYVIITVGARLESMDRSLEEAARDLGATPWRTFWKVTFPLLRPAILSGALVSFTLSFDDFLVAYFTTGPGAETLPIRIYSMVRFGMSPEIHALSTLILAVTLVCVSFGIGGAQVIRSGLKARR